MTSGIYKCDRMDRENTPDGEEGSQAEGEGSKRGKDALSLAQLLVMPPGVAQYCVTYLHMRLYGCT